MRWWTARQLGRELAEMNQLISDSRVVGCEQLVRGHVGPWYANTSFLDKINMADTQAERWAACKEAASLSHAWRLRRMMRVVYPRGTYLVRKCLVAIHTFRRRLGVSTRKHEI